MSLIRLHGVRRISSGFPGSPNGRRHEQLGREGIVLELCDQEGRVGLGEASPIPGYGLASESIEACEQFLRQLACGNWSFSQPEDYLSDYLAQASSVIPISLPAARHAVETAIIDLLGKQSSTPAENLLALYNRPKEQVSFPPNRGFCKIPSFRFGLAKPAVAQLGTVAPNPRAGGFCKRLNRNRPAIPLQLSKIITGNSKSTIIEKAREAAVQGFSTIKVKLGAADCFDSDLALLRDIRSELGRTIAIRLDANQLWSPSEAPRLLDRLAIIEPELVEEPVAAGRVDLLPESPVAIALDESLQYDRASNVDILDRLAASNSLVRCNVQAIMLKPMALGGLARSISLAARAQALGLDVIVTHMFDGPIALAATASLALAVGSPSRAHGLALHSGLEMDKSLRVLGVDGPKLNPVEVPGLPLALNNSSC